MKSSKKTVYLDNAATSFPKPGCVIGAMRECMLKHGGNPGRGSHTLAVRASDELYHCRCLAAEFFSADDAENVVFTKNATEALNIAIRGLIPDGSSVLISDMEHNSVLRCVEYMKKYHGVNYDVFSTSGNITENVKEKINGKSALVCLHSSNVVNLTLPIREIGEICSDEGVIFILDASQSAGHLPIDMKECGISALCVPGHKGLLGPQGSGMAVFSEKNIPKPLLYGGSGVNSAEKNMPVFLPDRIEAGTQATPCIAGLRAGMEYVRNVGVGSISTKETRLTDIMFDEFEGDERIIIYGKRGGPLFTFNVRGIPSTEVSGLLNERGICTRAGLHCSPLAHKTLGTLETGSVRASVGALTTENEVYCFVRALRDIVK